MLTLEYLAELMERHRAGANAQVREFTLDGKAFAFNSRRFIMGVINLSPDSWYRESVCLNTEHAIERGKVLHAQGADVVDIGAESTLAHAAQAGEALQHSRLVPVITGLRRAGILVSAET